MTGAPAKEAAVMIGEVRRAGIELDVEGVNGPEEAGSGDETRRLLCDDAVEGFDPMLDVRISAEGSRKLPFVQFRSPATN